MSKNDGRDDEIDALKDVIGGDPAAIAEQILIKRGGGTPKPTEEKKPDEKKPDEKNPDEHKIEVPDPEAIRKAMLNEMFGEQFPTVEDFKKANIPAALQELETLRRRIPELETQVKAKPKHAFATDELAMLNEFTRETGIKDVGVF